MIERCTQRCRRMRAEKLNNRLKTPHSVFAINGKLPTQDRSARPFCFPYVDLLYPVTPALRVAGVCWIVSKLLLCIVASS